jgi:DNA gyrase/topoisomerase IV subunit A
MCTKYGVINKTPLSAFANVRANGIIALGIKDGDRLISARVTVFNLISYQKSDTLRFVAVGKFAKEKQSNA